MTVVGEGNAIVKVPLDTSLTEPKSQAATASFDAREELYINTPLDENVEVGPHDGLVVQSK